MAILSNLFGNDSESGDSSDLFSVLDATVGIEASSESYHESVDDDGSSETSWDSSHFGTDVDVGSILSSMSDSFSDTDGGSGGLLG